MATEMKAGGQIMISDSIRFLGLWVFVFGLLQSSGAFAEEGFYQMHTLPPKHRPSSPQFNRALSASFRGTIGVGLQMQCSVQFVSPEGYAVTALHCFEPIPEIWSAFQITPNALDGAKWYEVAKPVSTSPIFFRQLSGRLESIGEFSAPARVVMLGKGFTASFPNFYREGGWDTGAEGREQVRLHSDDYMIVKLDLPSPVPCVQVSDEVPQTGTPVWVVGYPEEATRANQMNSDGNSQYLTYGKINATYGGADELVAAGASAQVAAEYDQMLLGGPKIVLSNDAYVGMSGGMVLNADGVMVASLAGGWSTDTRFSNGSTRAVKTAALRQAARENLGEAEAARIFNCPR